MNCIPSSLTRAKEAPARTGSRRQWLHDLAAGGAALLAAPTWLPAAVPTKPRVAAVFTEMQYLAHAHHLVEPLLGPYLFNGQLFEPRCQLVSMFADQFPERDWARQVSRDYGIPLYKTIDEALCVGGRELAVDAVLVVGEHGDYPENELGQQLYPRKQFFDQAVAVMRRADRYVPLFNDKHLSYRWDWAREMVDTSRRHGFPLMAGSSVPLAQRCPALDLPAGAEWETALVVHGGPMERYGFHGLELLQSFVEMRRGGETGIARIEVVGGVALERAGDAGQWSRELLAAAMRAEEQMQARRVSPPPPKELTRVRKPEPDHAFLITYRDGLRAAVLKLGDDGNRWNFACRLRGDEQPRATALFNGPWGNRCLFRALSHAIDWLFVERKEPYPVERTLLVSGALESALRAHAAGRALETPHLGVTYQPVDFAAFRESGASWQRITADSPAPTQFAPGNDAQLVAR